jgi:hypothetical protein
MAGPAAVTQRSLRGRRRRFAQVSLGLLTVSQVIIGGWALLASRHFFDAFPTAGHAWVALLPPYNEHLVRDVGALSLALAVVLGAATVTADRRLVRVAAVAFAVYTMPHTLFHGSHLGGFTPGDAAAQMSGFLLQLLLAAAAFGSTLEPTRGAQRGQL